MSIIDSTLVKGAKELDESSVNRSNICFSRLSMKIARQILSSTSPTLTLKELEEHFHQLASAWKKNKEGDVPFCCVEGVAYAVNAVKIQSIQQPGHILITVPFYCEFERGMPASDDNPNGEESPIQKLEEILFLLSFNDKLSVDLIFVNDAIAEKKDTKDGGSAKLFQKSILEYTKTNTLDCKVEGEFESATLLEGRFRIIFTSCEDESSKGSIYETADEKRKRLENRDVNGKLQERKGGAVLAGMEKIDLVPTSFADQPSRVMRCLVDGDSAHPVASFVGDAAYSILELGNTAYLGNMRHSSTCISTAPQKDSGEASAGASTHAKVMNRKLFFSGFIVPFLFPELSQKYKYTGTTQLPIKAFRGDINFSKAKLPTVQPNVDLGMLALLCSYLNESDSSAESIIDSGPVTIRDNVASSTMTTDDLHSEWTKTYGPIFTSAVGLCRDLKPQEFSQLPSWLTAFFENMELKHYTTLFGEQAATNSDVVALFSTMKLYKGADDGERDAVLEQLKTSLVKIFDLAL